MMRLLSLGLMAGLIVLGGCKTPETGGDLCERTFEPYPDLITGRVVAKAHLTFLHGMELYATEDYTGAADSLLVYLDRRGANKAAHLYLANCYLAMGKPYDAELQLDHLENSFLVDFRDQWEWYSVVCLVCSGQTDRALTEARQLTKGRRHAYKAEAERLVAELERSARP
jgi:hypothetical protein